VLVACFEHERFQLLTFGGSLDLAKDAPADALPLPVRPGDMRFTSPTAAEWRFSAPQPTTVPSSRRSSRPPDR